MNVPEIIDSVTYQVFNVAGSYIYVCPAGVRYIIVEAVGAGGSGARTAGLLSGGSGGSGAYFKKYYASGNYNIIVGTPDRISHPQVLMVTLEPRLFGILIMLVVVELVC